MNIPPDDSNPPAGLDTSSPADLSLSKKSSKAPLIVVAVLLLGGVGFFVWNAKKTHEERKIHASFMEHFQAFEKEDLMKFWSCILGPNADGSIIPSPDVITQKVDVQFASDFRNFPNKVREDCAKAAKDAVAKLPTLGALPVYNESIDKYGKAILGIVDALDDWAKVAPEQVAAKMVGKNVEDFGNAYHAFTGSGAPAPEVIAYDHFLHCADADLDKHKDNLELAKHLFEQCKDAKYRDKLQDECGKLVTDKPAQPTKTFKQVLGKISAEDRDVQAFSDCLRKARKGKLKDNLAPVGLRWVVYREARELILKTGAEALKE
jgi:hypothetical protein